MDKDVVDINEYRNRRNSQLLNEASKIQEKASKRNRAHTSTFLLMLGTAIFFDATQDLIEVMFDSTLVVFVAGWILNFFVSIFAWLTFYVWTSIKGWGMSDTLKQILVNWALPLVEFVPLLNALPAWTLKVVLTYSFLKAEDVLYNATGGKADAEKIENLLKKVA